MATIPLDRDPGPAPAGATEAAGAPRSTPAEATSRRGLWALAALLIGAALALLLFSMRTKEPGVLVVSITDPDGAAVPELEVLVDDQLRCRSSPCRIDGLEAGSHSVRATAPDHVPSEAQHLELRPGTDTIANLVLRAVPKTAALRVDAEGEDVVILVDGKHLGPPPVSLSDMQPGEHIVRVEGPAFLPLDHTVNLLPDEQASVGPLRPKVRRGRLALRLGAAADDAVITLDGERVDSPTVTLELDGSKSHVLVAEKEGFERFERTVDFPDGQATLSVEIELTASETEPASTLDESADQGPAAKRASKPRRATLNMNSIPTSTVLLNGKRLGLTPRMGVSTKPGVHSVTFVHPERGRKVRRVSVGPGQTKTVSVRF